MGNGAKAQYVSCCTVPKLSMDFQKLGGPRIRNIQLIVDQGP